MLGQITARGAPYVRRLALIYTMLDQAEATGRRHLEAALAVWRYAEASAAYVAATPPATPRPTRYGGCCAAPGRAG